MVWGKKMLDLTGDVGANYPLFFSEGIPFSCAKVRTASWTQPNLIWTPGWSSGNFFGFPAKVKLGLQGRTSQATLEILQKLEVFVLWIPYWPFRNISLEFASDQFIGRTVALYQKYTEAKISWLGKMVLHTRKSHITSVPLNPIDKMKMEPINSEKKSR